MRKRPISITIIGWMLLVAGAIALPSAFTQEEDPRVAELLAKRPVPVAVQQAMVFAGAIANLTAGYFLLRGQNWARHLYIAWTLVQLGYAWLAAPFRIAILPAAVFSLLVACLLFRPRANAFFSEGELVDIVQGTISPRRLAGIAGYAIGGLFVASSSFAAFTLLPLPEKIVTVLVTLLPAAFFLVAGRITSGVEGSSRDFGVVLLVSAAVSLLAGVSVATMLADPEFRELLPVKELGDYPAGLLWIAAMAAAGWGLVRRAPPSGS